MDCPRCKSLTHVQDSRPTGGSVRRRRKCSACGHRVTTFETPFDLADLLRKLSARLKHLEGEIAHVADVALGYMNAKLRRPKRGATHSKRLQPHQRVRRTFSEEEIEAFIVALRNGATATKVAADYGISVHSLRHLLKRREVARKPNGTAAGSAGGTKHVASIRQPAAETARKPEEGSSNVRAH